MSIHLRLLPRFLVLITLLTVLPVGLVGFIVVRINNDSLQFEVQRYHTHVAGALAEKFDERMNMLQSQLNTVALAMQNPQETWEGRQKVLSALIDSSEALAIISVIGDNGREMLKAWEPRLAPEVESNPVLLSHSDNLLFRSFKKTGTAQAEIERVQNNLFAVAYIPIDTPAGKNAIFVKALLDDYASAITKESIGQTGFAYIVSRDGEFLTEPKFIRNKPEKVIQTALSGSLGAIEFEDESGRPWVGAFAPLRRIGGAVITQQTRTEAYAESIRGKNTAIVIVLIAMLIAILASTFLARSLVRPLLAITRVAQNVDLGSGQFPEPVNIETRDEVQELAQTFNGMLDKLKGYADLQVEKVIIEQKKTEAIIFSIEDGIVMTDYQGRVQLMSRTAKTILGIPENDPVLSEPLWKFLSAPELKTAFVDLLTRPDKKKTAEVKLARDEKDQFYKLTAEQVHTPGRSETLGIVTVLHDVTLEKEIDSIKEEFLHSITHDLRNPLTAIRGFIRLFQAGQSGPLNDLQKKMLDTMDKASLRLLTMVNDILDLARLEANRLTLHLESCQITEIPIRVLELFHPQSTTNSLKLTMEIVGDAPPPLMIDPNLIERVFTNLVGNATKFTPDGGSITVRIEDKGDHLRCAVVDTGEGIPANYLEKVFDKFRQVEGHFKGGAGLGLTICKHIVEAHGGRIWVESTFGKGASFIFTIPKNIPKSLEEKAA